MTKDVGSNLCLITGNDEYLKLQKKNELQKAFPAADIDRSGFSEKFPDLKRIRELSVTFPFLSAYRVITLSETGYFKGAVSGEQKEDLLALFEELPDSTVLIFTETEADADSAVYKYVKKKGRVFRFETADRIKDYKARTSETDRVREFAVSYLRENGRSIRGSELSRLIALCGTTRENLAHEMEKLISYTYGKPEGYSITSSDIEAICSKTISDRAFDLLNRKLSGNTAGAFEILAELEAMRVSFSQLVFLLERQYHQAFLLKDMDRRRVPDAEIQETLKLKDWQIRKMREATAGRSVQSLLKAFSNAVSMEERFKSGDLTEKLAAELIIAADY